MNVPLIEITKNEALTKLKDYKFLNKSQKTREDERLESLYKAVSKGARVVNVSAAFQYSGLNEKGQPRLAIARADWRTVFFHPRKTLTNGDGWLSPSWNVDGAGVFSDSDRFNERAYSKIVSLPRNTFSDKLATRVIGSRVPHIPPKIRPKFHLRNFYILFEVENWNEYPVDPYLLRRIEGNLFVVIAEWELTKLEASLLSQM